jgi:hypothetical protein
MAMTDAETVAKFREFLQVAGREDLLAWALGQSIEANLDIHPDAPQGPPGINHWTQAAPFEAEL